VRNVERTAAVASAIGAEFAWTLAPRSDAAFTTFRQYVMKTAASHPVLSGHAHLDWTSQPESLDHTSLTDRGNRESAAQLLEQLRSRRLLGSLEP
jgi:hypothetical protein